MRAKTFYNYLNLKMPKIDFKYSEEEKTPIIYAGMKNMNNNILFDVYITQNSDNTFIVQYIFGEIPFNPKTLFLVNRFNMYTDASYKALIYSDDKTFNDNELSIFTKIEGNNSKEAYRNFICKTDSLFIRNKRKILYPLLYECRDNKFKPISKMN